MYTAYLVIGDWSNDGHGKTFTQILRTNFNSKQIWDAFESGSKLLGFKLTDYCKDYEDNEIPIEFATALMENGVELENVNEFSAFLSDYEYIDAFLATVKLGNSSFLYEIPIINFTILVGGYGLFYGD